MQRRGEVISRGEEGTGEPGQEAAQVTRHRSHDEAGETHPAETLHALQADPRPRIADAAAP